MTLESSPTKAAQATSPTATEPPCQRSLSPPSGQLRWLAALALAAAVLLLYWPSTEFGYVTLDDTVYLATNRTVHRGLTAESISRAFTDIRVGYWTPLLWISYMADVQILGLNPAGFHLTNVLLQAFVSALLVLVLLELTGALWPSLLAAALYSFHPLRVETVAWIAGRKDVLSMAFYLPALLAYARYARSGRWPYYAAMMACFLLGMMVKPILMTLPFLLLALDLWPLGRTTHWSSPTPLAAPRRSWTFLALEKIPVLAVSAAFAVSVLVLQGKALYRVEGDFTTWARLKMASTSYMVYLKKTFWPVDLPLLEFILPYKVPSAWVAVPSFLGFCALTWLAVRQVRRRPYLTAGWAWYTVSLLPVCGIVPAGMQWMADRFTYVPHLMFLVGLTWWVCEATERGKWARSGLAATAFVALALLAALSAGQMRYWKNGITLFSRALETDPLNYLSRFQLGIAQGMEKRLAEAEESFRKVIEQNPYFVRGHFFMAMTYYHMERYEEAARKFSEVLANDASIHDAHYMLGKTLNKLGDPNGAEEHLREYMRLEPDSDVAVDTLTILGVVKATSGEMDEAMDFLGGALDREPLFPQAHYNLALALWAQGRGSEAEPHLEAALTGNPKLKAVFLTLTEDVEAEGRLGEAADHLRRYLTLFPDDPQAALLFERLGILSLRLGDSEGAIAWFKRAVEREPDNLLFLINLAENLYRTGRTMESSPLFAAIAAKEPSSAEASFAQGRILLIRGRTGEANAAFQVGLLSPPLLPNTPAALRQAIKEAQ